MSEVLLPPEILQEQQEKSNLLGNFLEISVNRIMLAVFSFMLFAALFVFANVLVCFVVIIIKG
ncbi:uncharacterized protein NEMAJ01_0865 [Nematocida major]|uniref:uncharacterized protein n=1 Tax=Nematocida major TaxID=1912982 RepID=UPI0020084276|nr:uncharacterized protein NEMAJ01_0865 [Nematocida major]KAH9385969.1 hypothetical protein NEMAJ01_0865 [Nematocida major]